MTHDLEIIALWAGPFLSQYAVRLVLADIVIGAVVYFGYRWYTKLEH